MPSYTGSTLTTWQSANTTAGYFTTGATSTAATVDVWQTWTNGTNTTQIWNTWQTSNPVRLVEASEEDRRRHREQVEEHARQLRAAEEKAEELLLEHLSDEQRRDLAERRSFDVRGSRGGRYRICRGQVRNVLRLDRGGSPRVRLCAHPQRDRVPDADAMLAQALMLQTDEDEFLRIANSEAA